MLHAIAYVLTAIFALDLAGTPVIARMHKLTEEPIYFAFVGILTDGMVASYLTARDAWSMPMVLAVVAMALAMAALLAGWGQGPEVQSEA